MTYTEYKIDVDIPERFSTNVESLGNASLVRESGAYKKTDDNKFILRIYGDPDFLVWTIGNENLCTSITLIP